MIDNNYGFIWQFEQISYLTAASSFLKGVTLPHHSYAVNWQYMYFDYRENLVGNQS